MSFNDLNTQVRGFMSSDEDIYRGFKEPKQDFDNLDFCHDHRLKEHDRDQILREFMSYIEKHIHKHEAHVHQELKHIYEHLPKGKDIYTSEEIKELVKNYLTKEEAKLLFETQPISLEQILHEAHKILG